MKKMKTYILGMVLAFAMILLPQNVSAATQIPVTAVEDITDVMAVGSTNIKVPTGEYSNVVQFSLNKPSYVYVSAYSTVMHEDYDSLGAIEEFAVYSDANCSNLVTGDEVTVVWGNERKSKYLCLDAGNYWICFAKTKNGSYNDDSYGEFRLSVAAQYLNVTGTKNGSWGRAKQITTDKKVTGFLSSNTRKSWFKFKVSGDTTARLNLSLENPLGESVFESSKTGVTLYRSNHNVLERMNIAENYYSSACSKEVTLKSGADLRTVIRFFDCNFRCINIQFDISNGRDIKAAVCSTCRYLSRKLHITDICYHIIVITIIVIAIIVIFIKIIHIIIFFVISISTAIIKSHRTNMPVSIPEFSILCHTPYRSPHRSTDTAEDQSCTKQ